MDVVTYKCPSCGAPLLYEAATQSWDCHFCGSQFDKSESAQFEEQGAQEQSWEPEAYSDEDTTAYTCPSCGGTVLADKNTAATFCVYCHNPTVLAGRLQEQYRPARIIPFRKTREEAVTALQKLCGRKPLLPANFRDFAQKGEVTGLYVPFWLFSADAEASVQANGKRITSWSDSKYRYTKTDVYHIRRKGTVPMRLMPVDASVRMDDALMDALEPFSYDELVGFSMQYLSGYFAENYDVDSKDSFRRFAARAEKGAVEELRATMTGYTTVDGVKSDVKFTRTDCLYVLLPVWVMMVDYKNTRYTFAMNGQTGKVVGRLPVCTKRIFAWFGGIAAAAMAILSIGGLFL